MTKCNNKTNFNKIIVEEDMMTIEEAIHMIVIIMESWDTMQEIAYYQEEFTKIVGETTNLTTEEDMNVDGIVMLAYEEDVDGLVMMANEEVVRETKTTWYLDIDVGNYICVDKQSLEEMKEVVDGCVMVGDESNVKVKKESAWDLKYKNVNNGQEEHHYKPKTLTYSPQMTYEIGEHSNISHQNHISDKPIKPRMRSMQYLYESTTDINYDEVFSPIAIMETITLLISQAAPLKWKFYQMGVTSMFSYRVLEDEVYMEKPPRFMKVGRETQVLNLNKALYWLKLAPQAWITRISSYLKKNGYCNETYAKETIKRFNMAQCNPMATPMAPGTKFSKFREEIKWMLGTLSLKPFYSNSANYKLIRYSDSNCHRNVDDLKSKLGYVFYIRDTSITWTSKMQSIVTLSTCEADYVAISWSTSSGPYNHMWEHGVTRLKEYTELTPAEAIQADCDIKVFNALVSQHHVAKDLWEKIKLLMQGTSLTKQERECKLYDEFDKFTYKKGESTSTPGQWKTILENRGRYLLQLQRGRPHVPEQLHQTKEKREDSWFNRKSVADQIFLKVKAHETFITHIAAYQLRLEHMTPDCDELTLPKLPHGEIISLWFRCLLSDSNIIPYSQYVIESQQATVQNSNSSAQQDALILSVIEQLKTQEQVKVLKEGQNVDLRSKDNVSDICAQSVEIDLLKQTLSEHLKEKESLLQTRMSKDIVNLLVNPSVENDSVNVHECQKCLKLETELQTNFVKRETYDKLFKSFTILEKHCISLEVDTQLKQEIFQRENSVSNQSVPSFDQLFELNELKAQSQEKDTVIKKLKERIKSLSGKMDKDKIKQDLEEIETINIELDHRVTKLIAENEHLKQTYKQLYDSIKPARIRSKEQCDDLINQVNIKSAEISDLNASLQEKDLAITTLKDDLRKLKGKAPVDNAVTKHTIDLEMLKIDVEPITPKLYAKLIQELLTNISKTCPSINNTDGKLVAVTPKNKDKRVRFTEPVTSSGNTIIKTASTSNLVSNKPMLSSTGVKLTQKNKVEAHPRKVKSSLKNKDCVVAPKGTAYAQHSKLNANSEIKCVKCNGCMLYDNHDMYVLDFINIVNARVKSKSIKKSSTRKVWKPTGKVFTNIGYIWRPTGRTFTLVGNACPLTRTTTTTEVPFRKPTTLENETSP
ncbi:retrovirus-related pol polyprotein from transposon TNT 1-94 [Tanacetum coccineum]